MEKSASPHPFYREPAGQANSKRLVIFTLAEIGEHGGQGILGIPEEHIRIILEIEWVLDLGITGRHAPLESHRVFGFPSPLLDMNLGAGKIRFPPESKRTRFSGKDGLDHFGFLDSGQAHVQTLVLETEIFVVDSELMEHGGM